MSEWLLVFMFLVVGFIFILIEMFLIPGVGVTGIIGFLSLCYAIYLAYTNLGTATAVVIILVSAGCVIYLIRILPRTPFWRKVVLHKGEDKEEGYTAVEKKDDLIGKEGMALTDLHPVGRAIIENRKLDVISQFGMIKKGDRIVVVKVEGPSIIVRKAGGNQ